MKTKKIVFTGLMMSLLALSVMGKNNFNQSGWGLLDTEPKVTEKQVLEFVGKELIQPIKECYAEAYPHAFMSKCYSEMNFHFDKRYDWQIEEGKDLEFYENQYIFGDAIFTDCDIDRHIGSVRVQMKDKEIMVQESFFSDWVDAETFTKSFCKKVKDSTKED